MERAECEHIPVNAWHRKALSFTSTHIRSEQSVIQCTSDLWKGLCRLVLRKSLISHFSKCSIWQLEERVVLACSDSHSFMTKRKSNARQIQGKGCVGLFSERVQWIISDEVKSDAHQIWLYANFDASTQLKTICEKVSGCLTSDDLPHCIALKWNI